MDLLISGIRDFLPLTEGAVYQNVNTATLSIVYPSQSENGSAFYVVVTGTCGVITSGSIV